MPNQIVNLTQPLSPYSADIAQIQQRQRLADLLQNQALQPDQTFSYNGIQAPIPATQGLSKILAGALSGYAMRKNLEDQKNLSTKAQQDATDWITQFTQGNPGKAEVPGSVAATPADVEDRDQGINLGTGASPMSAGQAIPVPGGQGEGQNIGSPAIAPTPLTDAERMALLAKGTINPLTSSFAGPMLMQEAQRQRLLEALGMGNPPMGGGSAPQTGTPAPAGVSGPSGPMPSGQPMPQPQQQPGAGGPAGGIPMQVWLATDPTGKAYMTQLAKDNTPVSTRYGIFARDPNNRNQFVPVGGALPQGALPYRMGPNGQVDVSPYPGQVKGAGQVAGAIAGAQAGAKFPFQNVTTPSGSTVPAFTVPGLVPGSGASSGPMPSSAPETMPSAPSATPGMPSQATGQPVVGQTTASKSYGEDAGKAAVEYENSVNGGAASSVTQNRMLDELTKNLGDMNPGKLAAVQKSIAEWKVATGLGDENDRRIAASSEVTDKLTGQLVSNALKSMTARPTQAEFQIFLNKFVPNMNMTPQGAEAVIGFMRQQNNLNLQKQQAFQQWKQNQRPENYRNFDTIWNQQMAQSPLTTPSSFGTANPKVLDWNSLPKGTP